MYALFLNLGISVSMLAYGKKLTQWEIFIPKTGKPTQTLLFTHGHVVVLKDVYNFPMTGLTVTKFTQHYDVNYLPLGIDDTHFVRYATKRTDKPVFFDVSYHVEKTSNRYVVRIPPAFELAKAHIDQYWMKYKQITTTTAT